MTKSKIEWTEHTWNPIIGCTKVSPGCEHCYAIRNVNRMQNNPSVHGYNNLLKITNGRQNWNGNVNFIESRMDKPLARRIPTMYFVNSMSDMFHSNVKITDLVIMFATMAVAQQHKFQILTKRPERMKWFMTDEQIERAVRNHAIRISQERYKKGLDNFVWPLPNVWLGVSAENQKTADERIPLLLKTPASLRFVSAEPLLGELDLCNVANGGGYGFDVLSGYMHDFGVPATDCPKIDWVIVGGESGDKARPMHIDWVRKIRDDCAHAETPFFFKQWGEWCDWEHCPEHDEDAAKYTFKDGTISRFVTKKLAGNTLDGETIMEMP